MRIPALGVLFLVLSAFGMGLSAGEYSLGIHPFLPATELIKRFSPLARQLEAETGHLFRLSIAEDYDSHIDAIGQDRLDIAYLGPASYVHMVERHGRKPILARLEVAGHPTFRGAIVCHVNSPLKDLEGLHGKRFAFGDPASTMSHLVPRFVLQQAIGSTDNLAAYRFLNSHHNVALGVLMGEFDAGAVKEAVFEHYRDRGLRLLAHTPSISEHLFVSRANLPEELVASLRQILFTLSDSASGIQVLTSIKPKVTGLVPAEDSDYANLRNILEQLGELGETP